MTDLADTLARVQERITQATQRAGRTGEDITLVAVTKLQPAGAVRDALAAGIADLGENYVQEAADKQAEVAAGRWHLLGHLQGNKAKLAVGLFDLIQSVDSLKLARSLGHSASDAGKTQAILLQVHLGDEETKFGLPPAAVREAAVEMAALPGVDLQGLMGIAPQGEDSRPYFREMKRLFDALPPGSRRILSMGMSADFESAIEEGATLIRLGTVLFGPRPQAAIQRRHAAR